MKKSVSAAAFCVAAVFVLAAAATTIICSKSPKAALSVQDGSEYTTIRESDDCLININTADAELLCALPGIGEKTAQAIIFYREENGPFSDISDIIDVKGIGLSTYEKICKKITT
ncbi:MAG: helix-hairpin-helix domain-containing protein [Clostridia bacterium]|nr:helix-hairpin-helix domain-containing protein [Clostridia bacterium]